MKDVLPPRDTPREYRFDLKCKHCGRRLRRIAETTASAAAHKIYFECIKCGALSSDTLEDPFP